MGSNQVENINVWTQDFCISFDNKDFSFSQDEHEYSSFGFSHV